MYDGRKTIALYYRVIQRSNLEAAVPKLIAVVILVTSKENIGQAWFSSADTTLKKVNENTNLSNKCNKWTYQKELLSYLLAINIGKCNSLEVIIVQKNYQTRITILGLGMMFLVVVMMLRLWQTVTRTNNRRIQDFNMILEKRDTNLDKKSVISTDKETTFFMCKKGFVYYFSTKTETNKLDKI